MSWCLLNNLPGLRTLDILIIFIGCTRRSTGSSKRQGLGMNAFVTSFSTRASKSGGRIQLYSQESSMKSYSYVKFMLMISFFGSTNPTLCKEFGEMMAREFEMSMIGELNFFLGFQIKQLKERDFHPSRKVYKGYSQEIQDG